MAIYADKKGGILTGRFRVEIQLNGYRKRGRFDTMAEAKDAERRWKEELASGSAPGAKERSEHVTPIMLSQLLRKAAPLLWNGSDHGQLSEGKVNKLVEWLGDPRLDRLSTFVDEAVIRLRKEGKAPGTINRYLSALHAVLKWGFKRKLVPELPEFSWQEEDEGRIRYLTQEEEVGLLATLRNLGYTAIADFVVVALDTGCRRSELLHAKRDQLAGKWLRIWKTKNGHARSVPLTPRARAALEERLPWGFNETQLRYAWNKAKLALGMKDDEDFVVHALRHTCATRLVGLGVNLRIVQQFMGHRAIQTTLRYAHVSDDMLENAADRLSGGHRPVDNGRCGAEGGVSIPQQAALSVPSLGAVLEAAE